MYEFKRETILDAVGQHRYYLETERGKFYLMVTSSGDVTALHADDLRVGTINDCRCRFSHP